MNDENDSECPGEEFKSENGSFYEEFDAEDLKPDPEAARRFEMEEYGDADVDEVEDYFNGTLDEDRLEEIDKAIESYKEYRIDHS